MNVDELLPRGIAEIEEESDPLLVATLQFEEAASFLDLESWIVQRLKHSEREIVLNLPVTRNGTEMAVAGALRVQHHSGGRPTMGPVRISRNANLHWAQATAMDATWQSALLRLPMGGAAGAILCDPPELNEREHQEVAQAYAHGLRGIVGPCTDILTPGKGCNEQTMAWMFRSLAQHEPHLLAAVAGKPAALWGVPGHRSARAMGVASLLRHILSGDSSGAVGHAGRDVTDDLIGRKVSVQGFGRIGSTVARSLASAGARLVATADASGGLYNSKGLNPDALRMHLEHTGSLFGYPDAEAVCNSDVLEAECDALVLAAAKRQVTAINAGRIRAPLVVEAVRGAVTRAAGEELAARGIRLVPYLVASAGTTVAAYVEWAEGTQLACGPKTDLFDVVDLHLRKLYEDVSMASQQYKLPLRQAGLLLAVERVAAQMRLMEGV